MKRNPSFVFKVALAIGDMVAIMAAFSLAYYLRIHFDPRPFYFSASTYDFTMSLLVLIPIWLVVAFATGLYNRSIYLYRSRLYGRLLLASAIGVMSVISYEYFVEVDIFPARTIAAMAFLASFIVLIVAREALGLARRIILRNGRGVLDILIVGNDNNSYILADYLRSNPISGYRACGIVARSAFVPEYMANKRFSSIDAALRSVHADIIIQTDNTNQPKVYSAAVDNHLGYMFVPSQEFLTSNNGDLAIIGSLPLMSITTTPLIGAARFVKRFGDIVLGSIFCVIASPIMLVIAVINKVSDPHGAILYREKRTTRFNKKRSIYKFRSMKTEYSGMTPEQAFAKMGKPELAKEYRANGDTIDNDPRITRVGRFLRATSLDELPQLFNVVRGDISLVGPRALQVGELNKYPNKNLILSVKSGLTGLAQVSGRREISFEERRLLDIYYIQHWSALMDIQIILRTITTVLFRRGAK